MEALEYQLRSYTPAVRNALDLMQDISAVNCFIQGVATRIKQSPLTQDEAHGLTILLEWQNEQMRKAVGFIEGEGLTLVEM